MTNSTAADQHPQHRDQALALRKQQDAEARQQISEGVADLRPSSDFLEWTEVTVAQKLRALGLSEAMLFRDDRIGGSTKTYP